MQAKPLTLAIAALLIAANIISVNTSQADPILIPRDNVLGGRINPSVLTRQPATKVTALTRRRIATPSEPFKAGSALSVFGFGFHNGDHKINQISLLQVEGNAKFAFDDQNADDPFGGHAEWYHSNSFISDEIIGSGGGEFDIPIPNPRAGYTPVIRGFEFKRAPGTDANIRTIGVRIDAENNRVRVNFTDDQGQDYRGWETRVGEGLAITGVPLGFFAGPLHTYFGSGHYGHVDADPNGLRRYDVTVQITWIPNQMVLQRSTITGTNHRIASGRNPYPEDKAVVQGFLFTFLNSDHHLMSLGANLNHQPGTSGSVVRFQDSNLDDPKRWFVNYITVQ